MAKLQWDIFCKVIDNFGDIGVSWRLASDLAARGQQVRLWVDDMSALAWMAPNGCAGVELMPWTEPTNVACLQTKPCDVLIEAFGCDAAPDFIAACTRIHSAQGQFNPVKPLWINLEYLSAESFVIKNHGLTNLVGSGPAAGWHKVFYYPGFAPGAGGLLRELDLVQRQAVFDRASWLKQHQIDWRGETLVSLFCYEPPALAQLINDLKQNGIKGEPVRLLVAAGRAADAVNSILGTGIPQNFSQNGQKPTEYMGSKLSISYLPLLTQAEFDHLLWACDINFVRGEDSMVRAIWAGKPFVWQIYPQDDGAHKAKLEAFLNMMSAQPSLQAFHMAWNGLTTQKLPILASLVDWQHAATKKRAALAEHRDLTTGLINYALENR